MERSQIGAKALSWRISILPSRASSSDAANVDARALRRMSDVDARFKQKIVESRPIGLRADQASQGLARLGERPDLARLEAHARQRMALGLPRVGGQEVVEVAW